MIYSKQRELVMDTLAELHGRHPSANELFARLHELCPSVSLATVYRNLGQLEQAQKITRFSVPGGADRFDDVTDGHLHMVCSLCSRVCDLPRDILDGLNEKAAARSGFEIEDCSLLFFGVCDACQSETK